LGAFSIVALSAYVLVLRRALYVRLRMRSRFVERASIAAASGVAAALGLVVLGTMVVVPAGSAASDSTRERVEFATSVGFVGLDLGANAGAISLGAVVRVDRAVDPIPATRVDLSHLRAPPDEGHGDNPARFLLVLAPLVALGMGAAALLRRIRSVGVWSALAALALMILTFALSFGLIAALSRVDVGANAPPPGRSGELLMHADLGSVIAHSLLFGASVFVVAGFFAYIRERAT
jgi:hypothetical protein